MRTVRSFVFFLALTLFPKDGLSQHTDDHGQYSGHEGELEPFAKVNKFLLEQELEALRNGGNITFVPETETVVLFLLQRFNCSGRLGDDAQCEECAESISGHIFDTLSVGLPDEITEERFSEASAILLHLLTLDNINDACTHSTERFNNISSYLGKIISTDGTPSVLTEEELDLILDETSHHYLPSSYSKCFDVETIFDEVVSDHENGATEDELLHLLPLVIANLLEGYCIGAPSQTDPHAFLEDIFTNYGHDGFISEEHFEEILALLSIGGAVDEHANEDEHGHAKRSLKSRDGMTERILRAVVDGHDHANNGSTIEDVTTTCFSGEELLDIHGVDHETGITEEQFVQMCPALLQQVLSKSCIATEETTQEVSALVWVYGTIAVLIISLGALVGGLIIPCLPASAFEKFIRSLIALAVAVLAGDALIHLLPLAIGIHGHDTGGHVTHSPLDPELSYTWKTLVSLFAIYLFYLMETTIGWISGHEHVHAGDLHMAERTDTANHMSSKSESQTALTMDNSEKVSNTRCLAKYGSLPIMLLIGDALHNFGDGLAIGAAFSAGVGPGISTSIAVLCHEIPHELGDVAMLLNSGMKLKTALSLNLLSALTAFVGLYLGIGLATTEVARQWIFALAAGMFLYVALADMMPQITNIRNVKDPAITFILQNISFLIGAIFIFVIALYEDSIMISF